jgi:hypothetical protein
MSALSDIEDFSTDALRAEIRRREAADARNECWYCHQSLAAHTCKHAKPSPVPGWIVEPARFVRDDGGCMGELEEYWRVIARNPVTMRVRVGTGATAAEATARCLASITAGDRRPVPVPAPAGPGPDAPGAGGGA